MMRYFLTVLMLVSAGIMAEPQKISTYMQLKDRLDRPQDGYCLDIVGSGRYLRPDMPLTAHNCKGPQAYADEIVTLREDGTLYFPVFDACVTVMGLKDTALPGNALMLKHCGKEEPFLNGPAFQHFTMNDKSQLQLNNSALCIVAGDVSHTTYSQQHRWRNLAMQDCQSAPLARSVWHLTRAGQSH